MSQISGMAILKLIQAIDGFVLDEVFADDLPEIALQALQDGYDSPTLCQLAAAQGLDTHQLRKLFSKALDELGLAVPSPAEAGLSVARRIAQNIQAGKISPYEGVKQIWRRVYIRFPEHTELRSFVGLASEYEDDETHREGYSRQIVDECEVFLSGRLNNDVDSFE